MRNREILKREMVQTLLRPIEHLPVLQIDESFDSIGNRWQRDWRGNTIYIVESDGKLAGTCRLTRFMKYFFHRYEQPRIHSRHILESLTDPVVREFMHTRKHYPLLTDSLESALELMVKYDQDEIAVLDEDGYLRGELSLTDIAAHLAERGPAGPEPSNSC